MCHFYRLGLASIVSHPSGILLLDKFTFYCSFTVALYCYHNQSTCSPTFFCRLDENEMGERSRVRFMKARFSPFRLKYLKQKLLIVTYKRGGEMEK